MLEGSESRGAAWLNLVVEDEKGSQIVQGQELNRQGAVPAGCLDCPSCAVDGFRHPAGRECDSSELHLAVVVHADVSESLGQGETLFVKGPCGLQIPGTNLTAS
jgi:hypothetical protein